MIGAFLASAGLRQALLVIAVSWLGPGSGAAAKGAIADEYLGRPIKTLRLELEGREIREQTLLDLVETRVGKPLSMADVRETIAHLIGLGRFQDVRVHAGRGADGIDVMYELVPLHAVRQIVFHGSLRLPENLIRAAVVDRFGVSPAVGRAPEAARALVTLYQEHGYLNAQVTPRTEIEHAPERTTLIFDVEAGEQARIGTIELETRPDQPRAQVLGQLGLQPGQPYEQPAVLASLAKYAEGWRSRGYYEARAEHTARFSPDQRTADLDVTVDVGPRIEVVFQGDPLPQTDREELVPVRREGSIDEDLLEDSKRRIEAYLREQGYKDAAVEYVPAGDERLRRIVFTVHRGSRYAIGTVEITGNASVASSELKSLVRLEPGEPFVRSALDAAIGRVTEAYQRRGFAGVKVEPASNAPTPLGHAPAQGDRLMAIGIHVTEGVRTLVGSVGFSGNAAIDDRALIQGLGLTPGNPFLQPQLAIDRDGIVLKYLNRGYQSATADADVSFSADRSQANIRFVVHEGPQVLVDHILIVGNNRTGAATIERELILKSGGPLALNDLVESQRRLSALGLFRRVRITELRHAGSATRRDVLVTVEESPATTIGYGGGVEGGSRLRRGADEGQRVDVIEFAPRGFFEIGRRNLWGKNRSVNLFTRVSFRPRNQTTTDSGVVSGTPDGNGYGFNEYRALTTYREPRVFGSTADALVTGVLEQAIRSSFNFSRRGVRLEVARRLTPAISLAGGYSLERTRLFDERYNQSQKPEIDRLFPQVRLSSFSTSLIRDTRDDPIDPAVGQLIGLDGELAARSLGSEVGFAKTFLQGFLYRRLPGVRRIVFAGGARLGIASGFPREVVRIDSNGQPAPGPDGSPIREVIEDVPASKRFFAGGDTTVRGFALDLLGTSETIDQDGFPTGGHGLVIFNAELRVPVWRDVGAVGFIDAGNVFARVDELNLADIRGAAGFGMRYKSPIGPIRIDLGFKLDRRVFPNGREPRTALHISLGQAF